MPTLGLFVSRRSDLASRITKIPKVEEVLRDTRPVFNGTVFVLSTTVLEATGVDAILLREVSPRVVVVNTVINQDQCQQACGGTALNGSEPALIASETDNLYLARVTDKTEIVLCLRAQHECNNDRVTIRVTETLVSDRSLNADLRTTILQARNRLTARRISSRSYDDY